MSKTKPLHDIFDRLHIDEKTRRKTEDLFREAIYLTRPSSDYALTQGQHGLPAACLFIASSRLGNTDITKKVAQHAACIDPKTFDKVLTTLERALSSRPISPVKTKTNDITFRSLVKQYQGREDACVAMAEVEAKLLHEKAVENTATPVYQGAIFSWIYVNVFETSFPGEEVIKKQVQASLRDWSSARRIIDKCCSGMKETLKSQAETANSRPRTRRSQSFRIIVPVLPVTPTKKTPERISLTSSSKVQAMKRKVSNTNNILMDDIITSPSKRARTITLHPPPPPPPPPPTADDNFNSTTPTKPSNPVKTTEKSTTLNLDNRESNLSTKTTPATGSRSSLFEPSSAKTSDPSSPPSMPSSPTEKLALSRQATRRRVQSLSLPTLKRLPILNDDDDEEDISTRQRRRKLRAAFLDPDIYGWKPSPVVSRRLKLAERWEKELISNFGDPWDDWLRTRNEDQKE